MKKTNETALRTAMVLKILMEESDENHRLSLPEMIFFLQMSGIQSERRSVYAAIGALEKAGFDIRYNRKEKKPAYYLHSSFHAAEITILSDALEEASSLSEATTQALIDQLIALLPKGERERIYLNPAHTRKTNNEEVKENMDLLLDAIYQKRNIEFLYYDYTVTKEKVYRRQKQPYQVAPYAILFDDGRYYLVAYSKEHEFTNYRIDKMEQLILTDSIDNLKPFDAEEWMNSSIHMFKGEPTTVSIIFDKSLANVVFDRFGTDILISKVTDTTFTAHIKTAITPTLIAWLLQFYDRMTVIKPQALIQSLLDVSRNIQITYGVQ